MLELSNERIECILEKETLKTEPTALILRAIYNRYRYLYEKYFADIEALTSDKIAELKKYHEETKSLVRYYYMDIPQDTCNDLQKFEEKFSDILLGPSWHQALFEAYEEYKDENWDDNLSETAYKEKFSKYALKTFYEAMDNVFRDGFGTGSKIAENVISGISSLFFGKKDK